MKNAHSSENSTVNVLQLITYLFASKWAAES